MLAAAERARTRPGDTLSAYLLLLNMLRHGRSPATVLHSRLWLLRGLLVPHHHGVLIAAVGAPGGASQVGCTVVAAASWRARRPPNRRAVASAHVHEERLTAQLAADPARSRQYARWLLHALDLPINRCLACLFSTL